MASFWADCAGTLVSLLMVSASSEQLFNHSRGEQWMDTVQSNGSPFLNLKSFFRTSRQAEVIMMAMRLRSWLRWWCCVVLCCLQIQAGGCCSSVCGDCSQSTQPTQWKEKLTSGYGYGLDHIFIIILF